eukprot:CAMPEP_0114559442 /NCGR_PEP_ID=MMETSP0114-20121206/10924_1 /TAXON_ID=31324 /ORGANISM="Goniomonas sp, Strain m" /LENGTH=315 /DNA_ID=CAMNT_0001744913 /DNA_START=179 /DNA_END=1124 /DNA_ORIENTATION=-
MTKTGSKSAFAKLEGPHLDYYIRKVSVLMGRKRTSAKNPHLDLDLGSQRVISHLHAEVTYNDHSGDWELQCHGKNGLSIQRGGHRHRILPHSKPFPLKSRDLIQVCGTPTFFHFLLPVDGSPGRPGFSREASSAPGAAERPALSFEQLVSQALSSTDQQRLPISTIYTWIKSAFPYYAGLRPREWQNVQSSVRHCLLNSNCFQKVTRADGQLLWTLNPANLVAPPARTPTQNSNGSSMVPNDADEEEEEELLMSSETLMPDAAAAAFAALAPGAAITPAPPTTLEESVDRGDAMGMDDDEDEDDDDELEIADEDE